MRIKRQGCTKLYQHYSGLLLCSCLSWLAAMMFFSSKIRISRSNIPRHDRKSRSLILNIKCLQYLMCLLVSLKWERLGRCFTSRSTRKEEMWFCAFDLVLWLSWSGEGAPEEHVFSLTPTKECLQRAVSNVSVLFFSDHGWYVSSALSSLKFRTKTS